MVEKCEIMREVAEGLNSIKAESPSRVTEPVVKTKLCEIGRDKFGFHVCAKSVEKTDGGEWLFDVTWLKYDCEKSDCDKSLVYVPLAAECEWGARKHIYDDFQKLLLARASVVLMIFEARKCSSKEMADWLAEKVGKFRGSGDENAWLLAAWERNDYQEKGWSFRYFTIQDKVAIPFRTSSEG